MTSMDSVMDCEEVVGKEEVEVATATDEEEEVTSASETENDELEPKNWDYDMKLKHIFRAFEDETDFEDDFNPIRGELVSQVSEILQDWKETITNSGNAPTHLALDLEDLDIRYTSKNGSLRDGLTVNDLKVTDATRP
jgi:hypothetical protein